MDECLKSVRSRDHKSTMPSGLAASKNGRWICRSQHSSGPVELWDLQLRQRGSIFPTVLEAGGDRLAVSPTGDRVVAGAFAKHGVAVYDTAMGKRLWQNKTVKKVQEVHFTSSGVYVWCISDVGAAQLLDLATGNAVSRLRAIRWMRPSLLDSQAAWFDGQRLHIGSEDGSRLRPVEVQPENMLIDGVFGRALLWVSEMGGPLRCYELTTREQVAQLPSGPGWHWTDIGYCEADDTFSAIKRDYDKPANTLHRLSETTGQTVEICSLKSFAHVFCQRGELLLGGRGDLRRVADGELVHDFNWSSI